MTGAVSGTDEIRFIFHHPGQSPAECRRRGQNVDDTISLLSVALEQAPELDEERVAIVGFSRGGGVGLLTAARDPRIDAVVEFFGLTDLFDEYAREIFEEPWS